MPEEQTADLIDRAYDAAEGFVDGIGVVLGVDTSLTNPTAARVAVSPSGKGRAQLPTKPTLALPPIAPIAPIAPVVHTAPAPAFLIVESHNAQGRPIWIVTNGIVRAECATRAYAESVIALIAAREAHRGTP